MYSKRVGRRARGSGLSGARRWASGYYLRRGLRNMSYVKKFAGTTFGKVTLLLAALAVAAAALLLTRPTYASDPTYDSYGEAVIQPDCGIEVFDLLQADYNTGSKGIWETNNSKQEVAATEDMFINKNWALDENGLNALAAGDSLFAFMAQDAQAGAVTYRVEADGPFSYAVVKDYDSTSALVNGSLTWTNADGQADIPLDAASFTAYRTKASNKDSGMDEITVRTAVIIKVPDGATTAIEKIAKVVTFRYDGADGQVSATLQKDGSPLQPDTDHILAYGDTVTLTAVPAPYTGTDGRENIFDSFREGAVDGPILSIHNPYEAQLTGDMHAVAKIQTVQVNHIKTPADLQGISADPSGYYKLDNDIDMTGQQWTPLTAFSGTLDGGGYEIIGLSSAGEEGAGMFVSLQDAQVKNLTLRDGEASGQGYAGMLAGSAANTSIISLRVEGGSVTGGDGTGGLVGYADSSVVLEDIAVSGCEISGGRFVGGVAGDTAAMISGAKVSQTTIHSSYIYTNLSSGTDAEKEDAKRSYTGGVAGRSTAAIKDCQVDHTALDSQGGAVGGVVGGAYGQISYSTVTASSVEGAYRVGGIAGYAGADIRFCDVLADGAGERTAVTNRFLSGLSGSGVSAGGVVGAAENALISDCSADTDIVCYGSEAGGILGTGLSSTFENVTAKGTLMNYGAATGGVAGALKHTTAKSYTGGVTYMDVKAVGQSIGGVVGRVSHVESGGSCPDFNFVNCFAAGSTRLVLSEEDRVNASDNNYAYWGALYGYQARGSGFNAATPTQHFENSGVIFQLNLTGDYQKVEVFNLGDGSATQEVVDNADGSRSVRIKALITASMGTSETKPYGCMSNYGGIFVRITKADGSYVYASNMDRTKAAFVNSLDINLDQVTSYPAGELASLTTEGSAVEDGVVTVQTASQLEHLSWLINGYIYGEPIGSLPVTDQESQRELASIDLKLGDDIDLTQSAGVFGGHNFYGIGWASLMPYLGSLDGGGHTLTVDIDCPNGYEIGVLGAVSSNAGGMSATPSTTEVKNLIVRGRIVGAARVGVVAFHDNYAPATLYDNDRSSYLVMSNVDNYAEMYGVGMVGSLLGATSSTDSQYASDATAGTGTKFVRATLNDCHAYGPVYGALLEDETPRYISNNQTGGIGGLVGTTGRRSGIYGAVTLNGCSVEADIYAPGISYVGGLVGCNQGHIYFQGQNAMNGDVAGGEKVGALTGSTYYGYEYADAAAAPVIREDLAVKAQGTAGGITGVMSGPGIIENLTTAGTLTVTPVDADASITYYAGGIVGQVSGGKGNAVIRDVTNNCDVLFNAVSTGDGFVQEREYKVDGVTASGSKSGQTICIGGIAGRLDASQDNRTNTLTNVRNNGDVVAFPMSALGTTYIYAGGIFGDGVVSTSRTGVDNVIENPLNTGRVRLYAQARPEAESSFWQYAGGYFGRASGGATFRNLQIDQQPVDVQVVQNGDVLGNTDVIYNRVGGFGGSMTGVFQAFALSDTSLQGSVTMENRISSDASSETASASHSDYVGGLLGEFGANYDSRTEAAAQVQFTNLENRVNVSYIRSGAYVLANTGDQPASKTYGQTVSMGGLFGNCTFSTARTTPAASYLLSGLTNSGAVSYNGEEVSADLTADYIPVNTGNLSNITMTLRAGGIAGYLALTDSATAAGTTSFRVENMQNSGDVRVDNGDVVCTARTTDRNQTAGLTGGNRFAQTYQLGGLFGYVQNNGSAKAEIDSDFTGWKNSGQVWLDDTAAFHSEKNGQSQNSFANESFVGGLAGYLYNVLSGADGATSQLTITGAEDAAAQGALLNAGNLQTVGELTVETTGTQAEQLPSVTDTVYAGGLTGRVYNNFAQGLAGTVDISNFSNTGSITSDSQNGYTMNAYAGGAVGHIMGNMSYANADAGVAFTMRNFQNDGQLQLRTDGYGSTYYGGLIGYNGPNSSRSSAGRPADYTNLDFHASAFENRGDILVDRTGEGLLSSSTIYAGGVMAYSQEVMGRTGAAALSGLTNSGALQVNAPASQSTSTVYTGGILGYLTGQAQSSQTLGGHMDAAGSLQNQLKRGYGNSTATLYTGALAGYANNLLPSLADTSVFNMDIDLAVSGRLNEKTSSNGTRISAYGGGVFGYLGVPSVEGQATAFSLENIASHGSVTLEQDIDYDYSDLAASRVSNEDVSGLGGIVGYLSHTSKNNSNNTLRLAGLTSDTTLTQHVLSDYELTSEQFETSLSQVSYMGGIVGYYNISNPSASTADMTTAVQTTFDNCTYSGEIYYLNNGVYTAVRNGAPETKLSHSVRQGGLLGCFSHTVYPGVTNEVTLQNCRNEGNVKADYNVVSQDTGAAENNARTESLTVYAAGGVGLASPGVSNKEQPGDFTFAMLDCINTGAVSVHSGNQLNAAGYVGGLAGQISSSSYKSAASSIRLEDLDNSGDIAADFTGYGNLYTGGVAGQVTQSRTVVAGADDQPVTADRLVNSGDITVCRRALGASTLYTGGVAGSLPYHTTSTGAQNAGGVDVSFSEETAGATATGYTGGLYGLLNTSYNSSLQVVYPAVLQDGVNSGGIQVNALPRTGNATAHTGGVIGYAGYSSGRVTLTNMQNSGDVRVQGDDSALSGAVAPGQFAGKLSLETGGLSGRYYGYTAQNDEDKIQGCWNTGDVWVDYSDCSLASLDAKTGGLTGYQRAGAVSESWNSGGVTVDLADAARSAGTVNTYTGGLTGYAENTLTQYSGSYNAGGVTLLTDRIQMPESDANRHYAGGLIGYSNAAVDQCFHTGNLLVSSEGASAHANYTVFGGGLVGYNPSGRISNAYSIGNLTLEGQISQVRAGGLSGYNESSSTLQNCYNAGRVETVAGTSSNISGAVCGTSSGTLVNNYYDSDRNDLKGVGGSDLDGKAEGKTNLELTNGQLVDGFDGAVWTAREGYYPALTAAPVTHSDTIGAAGLVENQVFYPAGEERYTVTYAAGKGTGDSIIQTYSESGGFAAPIGTLPDDFQKPDGYTDFLYWNTRADGSGQIYRPGDTVDTQRTGSLVLYAIWTRPLTVRFDFNAGDEVGTTPASVTTSSFAEAELGQAFALIPQREGYDFLGWSTNPGALTPSFVLDGGVITPDTLVMADEDVTLYAVWSKAASNEPTYSIYIPLTVSVDAAAEIYVPQLDEGYVLEVAVAAVNGDAEQKAFILLHTTDASQTMGYTVNGASSLEDLQKLRFEAAGRQSLLLEPIEGQTLKPGLYSGSLTFDVTCVKE